MTAERHQLWSNYDLDIEDWRADLVEEFPDCCEQDLIQTMYEMNDLNLEDERAMLNIQLQMPIINIADLGLWYGRRPGYALIESGNIRDCLYSTEDYNTWYVDEYGDLRCDAVHHDGTNHYLYRVFRSGVSEEQIRNFTEKVYAGTATRKDINRLTQRLGDLIGDVYGWSFQTRKGQLAPKIAS